MSQMFRVQYNKKTMDLLVRTNELSPDYAPHYACAEHVEKFLSECDLPGNPCYEAVEVPAHECGLCEECAQEDLDVLEGQYLAITEVPEQVDPKELYQEIPQLRLVQEFLS